MEPAGRPVEGVQLPRPPPSRAAASKDTNPGQNQPKGIARLFVP